MTVWRIKQDHLHFRPLYPINRSELDRVNNLLTQNLTDPWLTLEVNFVPDDPKRPRAMGSLTWMMGISRVLILSQRSLDCLLPLIEKNVESFPLTLLNRETLYAIKVTKTLDCIDRERTVPERWPNEMIRGYNPLVLHSQNLAGEHIFHFCVEYFQADR